MSNTNDSTGRDQRVNDAIAAYLQAVDDGSPPDREAFVARYPDLAAELQAFLTDRERFKLVARPLGNDALTIAPGPLPVGPGKPRSLGLVAYNKDSEVRLPNLDEKLAGTVAFAISREPAGGSKNPDGPSGPVICSGPIARTA